MFNKLKSIYALGLSVGLILSSCQNEVQVMKPIIGKSDIKVENKRMTPEVLWSLGRLGDVQVSPDGKQMVYGVSYYSKKLNKSNRELFVMPTKGGEAKQLTKSAGGEYSAVWSADGTKIYYLAAGKKGNGLQIWQIRPDGGDKKQISKEESSISNLKPSPDGTKILFTREVKIDKVVKDLHPDLPLADAKIYDDLMYRHWDVWEDGSYSHIFVADLVNGKVANAKDIMPGEAFDSPLMPFGGIEEIT